MQIHHRFVLAISSPEGAEVGQFTVNPDWQPALEAVSLSVLRAGSDQPPPDDTRSSLDPVWDPERGEPHVAGVSITRAPHAVTVPLRFFRSIAQELGTRLVEENKLTEGAKFTYEVFAFQAPAPAPASTLPFSIRALPVTLPFCEVDFSDLLARSNPEGAIDDGNFPVFIEPHVLHDARICTQAAEGIETGGVLIGHLLRDRTTRDFALWITAQIPAQHAPATSAKLSFTPDTWVGVRAAITLRHRGEQMLGTWHSHPAIAWCAKCPPERQSTCALGLPFFSEDDVLLHRTVFSSAFCVGLVITHRLDGLHHGLFGWQAGLIEPRGFHLLGSEPVSTPTDPTNHAPAFTTTA